MDLQKAFDAGFDAVKKYIDDIAGQVESRLLAVEDRQLPKGDKGDAGPSGADGVGLAEIIRDADGNLVAVMSDGRTKTIGNIAVRDGADGKDGRDGIDGKDGMSGHDGVDGKDGLPGADGAHGVDGKDGVNGLDGKDGEAGKDGVDGQPGKDGRDGKDADMDAVKAIINEAVAAAVSAIPVPKDGRDGVDGKSGADGRDGVDGKDGRDGTDGAKGTDGIDGKDGIGLAGAFISKDGALVITTSDGQAHILGEIVGKNGEPGLPGRDGADGVGFDDLSVEHDGRRGFAFKFARGDRVKSFDFEIPAIIDAGVYKSGVNYDAGDAVTFGGSLWIAQRGTSAKPGESDDWRLSVKRGRDGKDYSAPEAKTNEPIRLRAA